MTLPKIDTSLTSDQLRRRVLALLGQAIKCADENCACQQGNGKGHGVKPA